MKAAEARTKQAVRKRLTNLTFQRLFNSDVSPAQEASIGPNMSDARRLGRLVRIAAGLIG
jgi:hypothetical protein